MSNIILLRINCPDDRCAAAIGETLVLKKLAGCVNIDGPVEAVYMWEDELVREDEWVVWAKAPQENYSKIEAEVLDMHPHEIPAILALPCIDSNARYADWLTTNTKL